MELCASCLFGLEGLVGDELKRMGCENVRVENGRALFSGDASAIAKANIRLRTAERVMILAGEFMAITFDELFEGVKAIRWEDYLPINASFPIRGHCLSSQLMSVPDCQSIIKKAIVSRLQMKYKLDYFPEDGAKYQIRFTILKDRVSVFIDTSGAGLHKRGYRENAAEAPLRETLAAAMVNLSRYRGKGDFADPFCGSGTIPIEAAMIALNRAPGLNRSFDSQKWVWIKDKVWQEAADEARDREFKGPYSIWGGDINGEALEVARANAKKAGVAQHITFEQADATKFARRSDNGVIVANPPYGERIMERREAETLYRAFGQAYRKNPGWNLYLLTSHTEFERTFGAVADKKRKLYNGMIKCDLFMYFNTINGKGKKK